MWQAQLQSSTSRAMPAMAEMSPQVACHVDHLGG
jgi:hypothetical protein